MRTNRLLALATLAALVSVVAVAAPVIRGPLLQLDTRYENNFPTCSTGQVCLIAGTDAGVGMTWPYHIDGDGGAGIPFVAPKTCPANQFISRMGSPNENVCAVAGTTLSDGGTIATEPLTAILPLSLYDDGGTVALSTANVGHLNGFFVGITLAAATKVQQSRFTTAVTFTRLSTTVGVAGSDAVNTFTVDVFDLTTTTVLCVTGNIPCNSAAGNTTSVACTLGAAIADDVQLRVNDGACTVTAPSLNIAAEYR